MFGLSGHAPVPQKEPDLDALGLDSPACVGQRFARPVDGLLRPKQNLAC